MILTPLEARDLAIIEIDNNVELQVAAASGGINCESYAWIILNNQAEVLSQDLTKEIFVGKKKLFEGFEKTTNWYVENKQIGIEFHNDKEVDINIFGDGDEMKRLIDLCDYPTIFDLLYEIEKYNKQFAKPKELEYGFTDEDLYCKESMMKEYESKLIKMSFTKSYNKQLIK